ncbi:MAG: universal stress protein [Lacibacter sp.]|jgi:nucleotide-binding universal stress UspA family protein
MNKILITTDLSKEKDVIINAGLVLAKNLIAEVELVVIINKNIDYIPADIGMNFSNQWDARKDMAERAMEEIKDNHPELNIKVVVFIGDPKEDIIEYAIESKASIIVIGTHGRTGLSHMVLGSTAEYIIRHSPIPVLVIPMNKYLH